MMSAIRYMTDAEREWKALGVNPRVTEALLPTALKLERPARHRRIRGGGGTYVLDGITHTDGGGTYILDDLAFGEEAHRFSSGVRLVPRDRESCL